MIWFIFAIGAAVLGSVMALLFRRVMRDEDEFVFGYLLNITPFFIFLPFAILNWQWNADTGAWLAVLAAGTVWTLISVINMLSYKYTEVSLRATVIETRTIWVLLLAFIILSEQFTAAKIIGAALVFLGLVIITYDKAPLGSLREKGVQLTLLAAFLGALAAVLDKYALRTFPPEMYAALSCVVPLLVLTPYVAIKKREQVKGLLSRKPLLALGAAAVGTGVYYLSIKALALAEAGVVYPVLRLSIVFSVMGGILLLREREHMARKIIASIIVLIGAIIASGYYTLT